MLVQITTLSEDWVYPELSFIAEFGGALGLFVGFSFYMIWDVMEWMVGKCLTSTSKVAPDIDTEYKDNVYSQE